MSYYNRPPTFGYVNTHTSYGVQPSTDFMRHGPVTPVYQPLNTMTEYGPQPRADYSYTLRSNLDTYLRLRD